MEAGEKELRKAFEDVTTRNVKSTIEFSNETRKIVKELESQVQLLLNELSVQKAQMDQFRIQLAGVQTKLFSGGT